MFQSSRSLFTLAFRAVAVNRDKLVIKPVTKGWLTSQSNNSATVLKLNTRTMATAGNRDLFYDDIVKLSAANEIVLIDVREPAEIQETGKLPGSVHIPLGEVPAALSLSDETFKEKFGIDKPKPDTQLVFSCRSGKRSQMALNKALEMGFQSSRHYAGGWLDWESKTKQ